jgi:hypothetical protein
MNDTAPAALGPQPRDLTEAELDGVSGGTAPQTKSENLAPYLVLTLQNTLVSSY